MSGSKKLMIAFSFLIMSVGVFGLQAAQLTPEKLAERPALEIFLKKAKIVEAKDVGEGITRPKKMTLQRENVEHNGIWKNPTGPGGGGSDKWEYEIAAYHMDKLLGLNMIPPTVERRYRGRKGSLQLWIHGCMSELTRVEGDIPYPPEREEHIERMKCLHRAFDSLIGNVDRTLQNQIWTEDWRLILIDHSRSFRYGTMHTQRLIYGKNGLRKGLLFSELPLVFVERIRGLTFEQIRQAVGLYLNYLEIEAILERKAVLLDEIDEMIAERGEGAVLY